MRRSQQNASGSLAPARTVGALLLCSWFNKHRFLAISILFVVAVPIVASLGYVGLTSGKTELLIASFVAGFCVLGIQSAINVAGAMVYPTSLRANGSGWELGIGRVGSIVGPVLGGLFVAMPVDQLFVWASLPFALGAVICYMIHRLYEARTRERPWLQDQQAAPAAS